MADLLEAGPAQVSREMVSGRVDAWWYVSQCKTVFIAEVESTVNSDFPLDDVEDRFDVSAFQLDGRGVVRSRSPAGSSGLPR